MKPFRMLLTTAVMAGLLITSHAYASADAGSAVNIRHESRLFPNYPETTKEAFIANGRTWLPVRDAAAMLQLKVHWDDRQKTATFIRPDKKLTLDVKNGVIRANGSTRKLDDPVIIRNGRIYVPVRFVAEWFDGEAVWEKDTRTVVIRDRLPFISASAGQEMYWFDHSKGKLYRSAGTGTPVELGSFKVPAGSGRESTFSNLDVEKMTESNRLLNLYLSVHGAGGGHYVIVLHGLFLKGDQILHHAELEYSEIYPFKHADRYDGYAVLSDGIHVRIVNAEGEIAKEYDLRALTGVDDRLMIENVTDRYMLVRPFKTPYLILVDLIKRESVKLYQLFYSEEEQIISENVGYGSYEFQHYFDLRLEKEEGDTLYFTSRSIETGEIRTYAYTIGR